MADDVGNTRAMGSALVAFACAGFMFERGVVSLLPLGCGSFPSAMVFTDGFVREATTVEVFGESGRFCCVVTIEAEVVGGARGGTAATSRPSAACVASGWPG